MRSGCLSCCRHTRRRGFTGGARGSAELPTYVPTSRGLHWKGVHFMRRLLMVMIALFPLAGVGLWAQDPGQAAQPANSARVADPGQSASTTDQEAQLRQQIEELKQTVAAMEKRLDAQEKAQSAAQEQKKDEPNATA